MDEPVIEGEISSEGALPLLAKVEELRTTGRIRFWSEEVEGEVQIVAGQLALDQPETDDGTDPVEDLLSIRSGRYEVFQRLLPLPVSQGDPQLRAGSLAVHVPADLMNYCERGGLTGVLTLRNRDRHAEVVYERGELTVIRVNGSEDADLHQVFGWEEGAFEIQATPRPGARLLSFRGEEPAQVPRRPDETGQVFLRQVEVALSSIVGEREKRRAKSKSSPPFVSPRTRPSTLPRLDLRKIQTRAEATVRIIYLGDTAAAPNPDPDPETFHVSAQLTDEQDLPGASERRKPVVKADAAGGLRGSDQVPDPLSQGHPVTSTGPAGLLLSAGWVAFALLVFVAALAVLARLPALE